MGPLNDTLLELLAEQRLRDLQDEFDRLHLAALAPTPPGAGVRGALASALVRWGLRLDPGAGERLAGLGLVPVTSKGGQRS